jgi:soluble lytic murein transglycosylase-like protein
LAARREYVEQGGGAIFEIAENPSANFTAPSFEINAFNSVDKYASAIDTAAKKWGVDPDLIRSVMYMEQTHGYYDIVLQPFDANRTILPMNVHDTLWGKFVGTRQQLLDPTYNINAGTKILAGIQANLAPQDRTVDKIATLYNKLGATQVSDYGARVNAIYVTKPWIQR